MRLSRPSEIPSPEVLQESASAAGARLIFEQDEHYPARLRDLEHPPAFIFTIGSLDCVERPAIAIVGARNCTHYGERVARELASALASAGVCIVSGLARGIDAAGHRGALAVGGHTCAVLGTGIDLAYPVGHASLQREIGEKGLVIAEMLPGARPHEGSFPNRNRIIAALASVTIVVEASRKSGALGTAKHANALGRTVAAVPGGIDSLSHVGSNELLRDGAHVILAVEDALCLAGVIRPRTPDQAREFTPAEITVLRSLGDRLLTTEQLVVETALPLAACLSAISSLEVDGIIETNLMGEFRSRKPTARRRKAARAS